MSTFTVYILTDILSKIFVSHISDLWYNSARMKICLVDDEQNCIDNLKEQLSRYGSQRGVSITFDIFTDGESFKKAYSPDMYDIIFFDIYIGETTGMELAKSVRAQSENAMIIFCTTSVSDMPEAFRYHAFEYIIKPAEYDRVAKIMDDAMVVLPNLEKFLDIQVGKDRLHFALSDLVYVTTQGHYLNIVTRNHEPVTLRMSLTDFSGYITDDERFLVINKGVLANLNYIIKIEDKLATMTGGDVLPIKSRESSSIKRKWQDYKIESVRRGQKKNYE